MQKTFITEHKNGLTDISKGQKIVAATYLITNHLGDSDPLKNILRTHAITLIENSVHERSVTVERIINLLLAAKLARLVSEQNVAILLEEVRQFGSEETLAELFALPETKGQNRPMSFMSDKMSLNSSHKSSKSENTIENKSKRQDHILSFINEKRVVGIKDIAKLFPDVSEKTIQRELGALVDGGKITKRGSKRWSLYMAIGPAL